MTSGGECKWRVTLPPTKADSTAYTITATSQKHGSIKISDVLFGDVYICSGQSNMVFPLPHVELHTDECGEISYQFYVVCRCTMLQMRWLMLQTTQ